MFTSSRTSQAAGSNPLPNTARLPPCDKRQHLHSYSSSSCPYNVCPECRELEALDTQIAELHSVLDNLATKRYEIKRKINRRHDHLTSHLPVEVISHIFGLVAGESYDYERNPLQAPVLLLGAVCRRWRDITLGTPGLWKRLAVTPRNRASFNPEILAQWLSRSCSIPLSLDIRATVADVQALSHPSRGLQYSNVLQSIRSQAGRWQDLTLQVPMEMLYGLLAGLEDRVILDSLTIERLQQPEPVSEMAKNTSKYLLVPTRLSINWFSVSHIPVQWDALTHLKAYLVNLDGLFYIFQHARNLRCCLLRSVATPLRHYPLPISPVTNLSIKDFAFEDIDNQHFEMSTLYLLRHLTLPSLETLRCTIHCNHQERIDTLSNFLDRSQPPLRKFSLEYNDSGAPDRDWYPVFPSITSLYYYDQTGGRMQGCLDRLGAHMEPMALPYLNSLEISGRFMNPRSWDALAAIFPDSQTLPQRPLKTVKIDLDIHSNKNMRMQKTTYTRLRAIRESGVSIKVVTRHGNDILGSNVTLTRSESEGRHRKKGRSENGMVTLKFSDIDEGSNDDDWTDYADDGTEEHSDEGSNDDDWTY